MTAGFVVFNDTATTEIYTLSLHDALPISRGGTGPVPTRATPTGSLWGLGRRVHRRTTDLVRLRSEEHTSELQSRQYLVCRLLLETKNTSCLYFFPFTPPLVSLLPTLPTAH